MLTNAQVNERWLAALDRGEKTFVGRPCVHGHDGTRFTSSKRACVACERVRPPRVPSKEYSATRSRARKAEEPEYHIWRSAKHRAAYKGLPFTIAVTDIVIPEFCPILGFRLILGASMAERDAAASLDRVDNSRGYVPGNVQVISDRANRIKNDSSLEELEAVLAYVKAHVHS